MYLKFIEDDSFDNFKDALDEISHKAKSILILSCDENNYDITEVNSLLKQCKTPILGAVFPQIIYKNKNYKKGTILASLDDVLDINIIENISSSTEELLETTIENKYETLSDEIKTMFVFVDGLSKNINQLIMGLFNNFGLSINYVGGGAGSLSFEQKPCLFTNKGILQDCAILAVTSLRSSIGVKHGWYEISEPIKVTNSNANVIMELDYEPAYLVYKDIVEKQSSKTILKDDFFDTSKAFPLGINKLSGESVVRDPILVEGNNLICVGDVATNSFISILKGDKTSLINAAKEANNETDLKTNSFTLFIDCISRALFMDHDFKEELDAVYNKKEILLGALSLGEIANNKKHYLEFYNKTAVVAKIERLDD